MSLAFQPNAPENFYDIIVEDKLNLPQSSIPSLTFTNDDNTGIYSDQSDQMKFSCGGTDEVIVNTTNTIVKNNLLCQNSGLVFENDTDTHITRSNANEITLTCGNTAEVIVNETNTIIKNNLLLNNNGLFFESDTDTGILRTNPNQISIRTNNSTKINVGDTITNFSNLCDFNSIIRESNFFQALTEVAPTLTISTVRQHRIISVEISGLGPASNALIDFDIDIANGEWYIIQVYNNTTNQGRVCNIRFNNGCFNLSTMGIVSANTNIQIHSQNDLQSFSTWLIFRHSGSLLHLQRIEAKNQDTQINELSVAQPIYWRRLLVSANYTIGTNESYNFYSCNCSSGAFTITLPNWNSVNDNGRMIYIHKQEFTGNLLTIAVPTGASLGDITNGTYTITNSGSIFMCIYNRVSTSNRFTITKLGSPATIQQNDLQFLMPFTNNTTTPSLSFRANAATSTDLHGKSGVNLHTDETSLNLITNNATRVRIGALETEVLSNRLVVQGGTSVSPGIVFSTEPTNSRNTGLFSTGDNIVNVSCNSTDVMQFNPTNIESKVQFRSNSAGSNSTPNFCNGGATNTGIYFENNANADVSISCNGFKSWQITKDYIDETSKYRYGYTDIYKVANQPSSYSPTFNALKLQFPCIQFDCSGGALEFILPTVSIPSLDVFFHITVWKVGGNNLTIKTQNATDYLNNVINGTHVISTSRQRHDIFLLGATTDSGVYNGWAVIS